MSYQTILYEPDGPVVTITLNRRESLNAINPQLEHELYQALDEADHDPEIRAIILTGAGRAFCAGYDMARPRDDKRASAIGADGTQAAEFLKGWWHQVLEESQHLMHLWYLSKPVIAAVHGWAMGGGFWYSLAADITIAAENAVFGQPEVRHVSNTTILFAALAGWKAAHRYGLTGDHFDATEALRLGVVNEVVPLDQLMPRARALAQRIALVPEPSVRLNKAVTCYGLLAMGLGTGLMMNLPLSTLAHSSHNEYKAQLMETMRTGGMKAFVEARDGAFRPEPFGPKSGQPRRVPAEQG